MTTRSRTIAAMRRLMGATLLLAAAGCSQLCLFPIGRAIPEHVVIMLRSPALEGELSDAQSIEAQAAALVAAARRATWSSGRLRLEIRADVPGVVVWDCQLRFDRHGNASCVMPLTLWSLLGEHGGRAEREVRAAEVRWIADFPIGGDLLDEAAWWQDADVLVLDPVWRRA